MLDAEEESGGSLQHSTPILGFGCLEIITIKLRRAGGRRRAGQGESIALTSRMEGSARKLRWASSGCSHWDFIPEVTL